MAPDLNTIHPSTRNADDHSRTTGAPSSRQSSTTASRRTSQIMSPPPLPLATPAGAQSIPNQQSSDHHQFPPLSPHVTAMAQSTENVPMRHPRPLTAAELHLEVEQEQEAIVNRLTRELSALRAHSASVASNASSAISGAFMLESTDPSAPYPATHPTASRRHRSSSSVSRGSVTGQQGPMSFTTGTPLNAATPHRYSISSQPGGGTDVAPPRSTSIGLSTPRYEEVAHYRQELEEAKKENEILRRKIRELERTLSSRRSSSTDHRPRGRSEALNQSAGAQTSDQV